MGGAVQLSSHVNCRKPPFRHLKTRPFSSSSWYSSQLRCRVVQHASREATVMSRALRPAMPTLTRILRPLMRPLVQFLRRGFQMMRPLGKGNVVFVVLGFIGAAVAAFRRELVSKVRSCKVCTGFGIQRCPLCSGKGMVGWEGKWSHREPCPSCLGRRYVECMSCGGRFHRPIFQHTCTTADTLLRDLEDNKLNLGTIG